MTRLTTVATIVGWMATVVVLAQAWTALAVPALAGWSVSTVICVDATIRRERVPAAIAVCLIAAAVVFVFVARQA